MVKMAAEIIRVKKALAATDSPYMRRDYEKHLARLTRKYNAAKVAKKRNGA